MEVDQGEKVEVRVAGRWACDHFIDYFHPNDDDDQGDDNAYPHHVIAPLLL